LSTAGGFFHLGQLYRNSTRPKLSETGLNFGRFSEDVKLVLRQKVLNVSEEKSQTGYI